MSALQIDGLSLAAIGDTRRFNRHQIERRDRWAAAHSLASGVDVHRSLRVLIADAHLDTTDLLCALVRRWGHEAWGAYNGAAALALARQVAPDVVLTDLVMPLMNGCELCRQIRHNERDERFLVALTADGSERSRRNCDDAGIDLVLVKPVDGLVLETLLRLEAGRLGLASITLPTIRGAARCQAN